MNNDDNKTKNKYEECSGTGVLSAIVFLIVAAVVLFLVSKFVI